MDALLNLAEHYAQIALAIVYFAGAIFAVTFWNKHPRSALYLLIAAGLSLAVEVVFITTWMVPDDRFFDDDDFFAILNIVDSSVRLISFILLMLAIFHGRSGRVRASDFEDL